MKLVFCSSYTVCFYSYTLSTPHYFLCSLLATVEFVSNDVNITATQRGLILPTELNFHQGGFCDLQPTISAARLQFAPFNGNNRKTLVLCDPSCNILENGTAYNFTSYGNIIVPNPTEGLYMLGMQQPCPSPSRVITRTYTVIFSSPSKSHVGSFCIACGEENIILYILTPEAKN